MRFSFSDRKKSNVGTTHTYVYVLYYMYLHIFSLLPWPILSKVPFTR